LAYRFHGDRFSRDGGGIAEIDVGDRRRVFASRLKRDVEWAQAAAESYLGGKSPSACTPLLLTVQTCAQRFYSRNTPQTCLGGVREYPAARAQVIHQIK
jgi:hypothetical protein